MNAGVSVRQQPSPWSQASEEYACEHAGAVHLTVFTASNATRHYRRQCVRCGANVGAVKKVDVPRDQEATLPAFDEGIRGRWVEAVRVRAEEIRRGNKDAFDGWYEEYLDSPEWHRKRDKVLARAGGRCEGCGERRATQVHHLTYTHVGRELLFQLVAVCRDCHEQIHAAQEQPE